MDHGSTDMDMGMDMGTGSCKISMLWNWYTVDSCFLSSTWHVKSRAQFAGSVIGVCLLVMAIEGVRRLGREYDRRLLRARNDAIVNAACGMGAGSGLAVMPSVDARPSAATAAAAPAKSSCCGGGSAKKLEEDNESINVVPAATTGGCGSKNSAAGGGAGSCGSKKMPTTTTTPALRRNNTHTDSPMTSMEMGGFSQMHCRPPIPSLPTWGQQALRSCIYGSQFSAAFLVMLLGMYFNGFILFAIFIGATLGYLIFGSDTVSAPEAAAKNESPCCC